MPANIFQTQRQSIRIKSPAFFVSKFLEIIYNDGIKYEIGTSNPKFSTEKIGLNEEKKLLLHRS